jgi:predicted aspartyl protease
MKSMIAVICRLWLALALSVLGAAGALASPPSLQAAVDGMDLAALQAEKTGGANEAERKLAAAIELGWLHQDEEALVALAAAVGIQTEPELKAAALWEISNIQMRRGEFAAAAGAGRDAAALKPATPAGLQTIDFISALIGTPPTRAVGTAQGRIDVRRDMIGLIRADTTVNGKPQDMVLDTGASFSTVVESAAQRLGLRYLDAAVSVGSSVKSSVASKLAVADRLTIGATEFTNVVFIVLPDKDLTLLDGRYVIEAIIGMPVFLEMGRIELAKEGAKESFIFGRTGQKALGEPNIALSALTPIAMATVGSGVSSSRISLLLDTGAQKTSLNGRFGKEFASLMEGAEVKGATSGGAGGAVFSAETRKLAKLDLFVAGKATPLQDINVGAEMREERHGILGLDALGGSFVIDFDVGRLDLRQP